MTPWDQLVAIDQYVQNLCVPRAESFEHALHDATAAGLPEINVSPNEGKLLYLLAKIAGARRILEIGLLGGYSTMWLASALPDDGRLVTLEVNEKFAGVARRNLERAGLLAKVEIRVGDARQVLAHMISEPAFDLVFIDADKESYPVYLDYALKLTRPGSVILADNVIRRIFDGDDSNSQVRVIRQFNEKLATCPELETILIPVVRERIDGLAIARRR
jgi:predicted O-methyltransferase YrrM